MPDAVNDGIGRFFLQQFKRVKSGQYPDGFHAGGLTGLIQHAARPGDVAYLLTSIILSLIGAAMLGGLFLLLRDMSRKTDD